MIIFYDAKCALCNKEMQHLKQADKQARIQLEDLNAADFAARYPEIDSAYAMAILHGKNEQGELIYGLDVTILAWQTVGKYRWLKILQLPVLKPIANWVYRLFAKFRPQISQFLSPMLTCDTGQCQLPKNNTEAENGK
ncbi:thiol-disulfide oxidoreductase DCC family protein [Pseudoalteromonas mariniglutinosa]|uniref:thiol-disulfide oxidoreductase DCC family protein n=1 Tax=Pseudoalteromonas mariniglutinosa TaxID=206042 RepID=UPI00384EFB41